MKSLFKKTLRFGRKFEATDQPKKETTLTPVASLAPDGKSFERAQNKDPLTQSHSFITQECPSLNHATLPEKAYDDSSKGMVEGGQFENEDAVKDAEEDTVVALSLSGPGRAHKQLMQASKDLEEALRLYFRSDENNQPSTSQQYESIDFIPPSHKDGLSPDQLVSLLSNVVTNESSKRTGLSAKVSQAFGKIYPLASIVMQLGVQTGDSFLPMKGTMGGLAVLLAIAESERSRAEEILKQLQNITYQCSRVAELQKSLAGFEMSDLLIESSTRLLTAIIVFFRSSIIFFRRSYFYNLGKALVAGPQIYADAQGSLNLAITEYDQALLLQVAISALSSHPARQSVTQQEGSRTQTEILRWLEPSYWETEAQYSSACERRADGTLHWLLDLDTFKRWRGGESQVLWLTAPPGVGKSVLAGYITQLLKAENHKSVVLYFFCSAGNMRLNSIERMIRTLAAQLMISVPSTRPYFQGLKDGMFESKNLTLLFDKLVAIPLSQMAETKYIVIDGLDECFMEEGLDTILHAFLNCLNKVEAKVVMTSRAMAAAVERLNSCLHYCITVENRHDIESYVSTRVAKSIILQKGFDRLRKGAQGNFMAEKAQGNFLWITIILGLLEKSSVSAEAFQAAIENIPDSLSEVYDRLLDKFDATGTLVLVRVMLGCILFSRSPLTVGALRVAVAIVHEDVMGMEQFIKSECGSFLTIDPTEEGLGIVQVIHETFKSYMMNNDALGSQRLQTRKCHLQLAVACLNSLVDIENQESEPLRRYAAEHWLAHFVNFRTEKGSTCEFDLVIALLRQLHQFLTNDRAFGSWIRQRVFIVENDGRLRDFCFFMADLHDEVTAWLVSEEVGETCLLVSSDGENSKEQFDAVNWRNTITSQRGRDLATFICRNLSQTWLNTNWHECLLSHWVYLCAMKTARILECLKPPDGISSPKSEPRKRVITHTDFIPTSTEEIDQLANLGGFMSSIGVQAGNLAFAYINAGHSACSRFFHSAIDEHPEWWHFHQGLGEWYYRNNEKRKAVETLQEAISYDPKNPSSAAHLYWIARSEICVEDGDNLGAIATLREAENLCSDREAFKYWDRMATIYRDTAQWQNVKAIYSDALHKRSLCRDEYWVGLANAYGKCYDWRGQLKTLLSAVQDDPENATRYATNICRLALELAEFMLFPQAVEILKTAITAHDDKRVQYMTSLASTYMAARQWSDNVQVCNSLLQHNQQDSRPWYNLGNAFLATGDVSNAIPAFQKSAAEKESYILPDTIALAYMVAGQFKEAIRILKTNITRSLLTHPDGVKTAIQAGMIMEMHFNLGQCYHAVDRAEDAILSFTSGIKAFECFKDECKSLPGPADSKTPIFRCDAQPMMIYGELLENVGRADDAMVYYQVAENLISTTSFVGDDDILDWEYEYCIHALRRLSTTDDGKPRTPEALELKKDVWQRRLLLRISRSYRVEWYSFMGSQMPRYRGGEDGWAARLLGKDDMNNEN